jgi:hypothetical protein
MNALLSIAALAWSLVTWSKAANAQSPSPPTSAGKDRINGALGSTLKRAGFSEDLRSYIHSYDAILILRAAKAAKPFTPPPTAPFQ